jgi:hypothetical protein
MAAPSGCLGLAHHLPRQGYPRPDKNSASDPPLVRRRLSASRGKGRVSAAYPVDVCMSGATLVFADLLFFADFQRDETEPKA